MQLDGGLSAPSKEMAGATHPAATTACRHGNGQPSQCELRTGLGTPALLVSGWKLGSAVLLQPSSFACVAYATIPLTQSLLVVKLPACIGSAISIRATRHTPCEQNAVMLSAVQPALFSAGACSVMQLAQAVESPHGSAGSLPSPTAPPAHASRRAPRQRSEPRLLSMSGLPFQIVPCSSSSFRVIVPFHEEQFICTTAFVYVRTKTPEPECVSEQLSRGEPTLSVSSSLGRVYLGLSQPFHPLPIHAY